MTNRELPPHVLTDARQNLGRVVDNRYELLSVLGAGPTGVVYEANNLALATPIVIKLIHPRAAERSDQVHAYLREARAAGNLHHDAIVEVLDAGAAQGVVYLVSERLVGHSLDGVLLRDPHTEMRRGLQLAHGMLRGLDAAHQHHIVHGDLKPSNLFQLAERAGGSVVKLLDFGVGRMGVEMTNAYEVSSWGPLPLPSYLSPEQVRGAKADARSDLHAAGVIILELLHGSHPFAGTTRDEVVKNILGYRPTLSSELPRSLSELIAAMLEKRPEARPISASEVLRELESSDLLSLEVLTR